MGVGGGLGPHGVPDAAWVLILGFALAACTSGGGGVYVYGGEVSFTTTLLSGNLPEDIEVLGGSTYTYGTTTTVTCDDTSCY